MVFVSRGNMKAASYGNYVVQLLSITLLSFLNINCGLAAPQNVFFEDSSQRGATSYGLPGPGVSLAAYQNDADRLELLPPKSPILGPLTSTLILSTPTQSTYEPGAAKNVPEAPYLYYRPPSPYRSSEPFDRNVPSRHTTDFVLVPYTVPGSISSEPLDAPPGTVVIL